MAHPTQEAEIANFVSPVGNYMNEIDCGVSFLPFLTKCLGLEKLAKFSIFVGGLSVLGFIQGVILAYFRGTSQLWIPHFKVPLAEWFILANEISVGMYALYVAYWGNRIHRASWMGALTIFLSISCATLAIPEIYNPFTEVEINSTITAPVLCNNNGSIDSLKDAIHWRTNLVTIVIIILFQIFFGLANIAFITLGITYLDDNILPKHSSIYIGMVFGANELGKQLGVYCSWMPYMYKITTIFTSPVWIAITVSTFLIGSIIAMFPKILPNILMMKSVNSLVSFASGLDSDDGAEVIDGFFTTMKRLLKNKILLLNIFSFVSLESALVNFSLLEKYFKQAKYHVSITDASGYSDSQLIQFSMSLLKQPVAALFALTSGMVISKFKPSARQLATWNVFVFFFTALIFSTTVFSSCTFESLNLNITPSCNSNCSCSDNGVFQPICVDGKTYFSPCAAGCNYDPFKPKVLNCSCGVNVSEGSCDKDRCTLLLAITEVNSVISYGLLASTMIPYIIINMRTVLEKDKAVALGLGLTFLGVIPQIPVKLIHDFVVDRTCEIKSRSSCQYFSEVFPRFLSYATILFIFLAASIAVVMLCIIKDLPLYVGRHYSSSTDLEVRILPPDPNEAEARAVVAGLTAVKAGEEYPFMRTFTKEELLDEVEMTGSLSPSTFSSRSHDPHESRKSTSCGGSLGDSLEAFAKEIGNECGEEVERETNSSGSLKTSLGYIVLKVNKTGSNTDQEENIYDEITVEVNDNSGNTD